MSGYQHHNSRSQRRYPETEQQRRARWRAEARAAAQREADYERRRAEEEERIQTAIQAQWDALTPEQQAAARAEGAAVRAASWEEHLYQLACRERNDRQRRDSITLGT